MKWVRVESNFGDGMFLKLLTPFLTRTYPVSTEEVHSSIQKEKRIIDTLEPVFNQHRLIFNEKVVMDDALIDDPKHQLFYQITRITREKGALGADDSVDALAGAVAYWVEQMDKDTDKVIDEHKDALLQKELDSFIDNVLGIGGRTSSNWNGDLNEGML